MGLESLIGQKAAQTGQLIGGGIKLLAGAKQKKEANKLLSGLKYPDEEIPTEITNAAATGLPSEQYNLAMKNIQRQQLVALRGAQDRRGGLAAISGIQQGTNDATLKLDSENAQVRQQNQFRLAGWKDKIWQHNIRDKYNRDYGYAMQLKAAGNTNLYGGVDQMVGGVIGGAGSLYGGGQQQSSSSWQSDGNGFNSRGYATGVPR